MSKSWKRVSLGEIALIQNGSTPLKSRKDYWESGSVPWFTIEDLRQQGFEIKRTQKTITKLALSETSVSLIAEDSILICCTASVGAVAINRIPLTTNQQFNGLTIKDPTKVDLKFLFYWFLTQEQYLQSLGRSTTISYVSVAKLKSMELALPPLDEQKRIVAKLDEALGDLDQMTSHTNKSLNEIDLLWSAGLSQFFGSTPQTIEHSADSTGVNAVLGDVAKLLNGRAYKQEELLEGGKYRVLRVGNFFSSNRWYWSDLELEENKYCEDGDLLYAWSASFGPRIWIGDKTIFHYHIWKVDFDERKVVRDWLKYWFEWDVEQVKGVSGVGTTMLHVTKGAMESRKLVIPSLENQRQIVRMLDSLKIEIDQMRSLKKKATQETSQLRSSILTAAFAGDF